MYPASPGTAAPAPGKLKPALIGGVALGVASVIPLVGALNCACCALVIGGGFLASYLYLKAAPPSAEAPYGDAALLGILTGAIGAVVEIILFIPMSALQRTIGLGPNVEDVREKLSQADIPPQLEELIVGFLEPGASLAAILILFALYLVIDAIFAMVGALIGVAVFHKKALPPSPPAA
jgi:hypothetical protein